MALLQLLKASMWPLNKISLSHISKISSETKGVSAIVVVFIISCLLIFLASLFMCMYHPIIGCCGMASSFVIMIIILCFLFLNISIIENANSPAISYQNSDVKLVISSSAVGRTDMMKIFMTAIEQTHIREPLPPPNGYIDDNGKIIPERKKEVEQQIQDINRTVVEDKLFMDSSVRALEEAPQKLPATEVQPQLFPAVYQQPVQAVEVQQSAVRPIEKS